MAFKSYAKGGNYGTYNVLPIGTEINEDLRIANEKVQNIQLTAQAKANHAQEYISALNNKFQVEQQNRDNNNQFFKDNHKRIYEGEQRQFEGEMAELKRRHAEEARKEAEPSTLEKALPHILSLVQIGAGMVAETAAAETEAQKVAIADVNDRAVSADINLAEHFKTHGTGEKVLSDLATKLYEGGSPEQIERAIGAMRTYNQPQFKPQWQNAAVSRAENIAHYAMVGDPTLDPSGYQGNIGQWRKDSRAAYDKAFKAALPEGYDAELTDQTRLNHLKNKSRALNSFASASLPKHQQAAKAQFSTLVHSRGLRAIQGKDGYSGSGGTPAQNLWAETKTISTEYFGGSILPAVNQMMTSLENEGQVDGRMLEEYLELAKKENPATAANPSIETGLTRSVTAAIKNKDAGAREAIRLHNIDKRNREDQLVRGFAQMEPAQQKMAAEELQNNNKFSTLSQQTQTAINRMITQGSSRAEEQATEAISRVSSKSQRDIVRRVSLERLKAENPNANVFNLRDDIVDSVVADTNRRLVRLAAIDPKEFELNPLGVYEQAAREAMAENTFPVTMKGLTATVGLVSEGSDDSTLPEFRALSRKVDINTGDGIQELLDANPSFNEAMVLLNSDIQRFKANSNRDLTNADLAVFLGNRDLQELTGIIQQRIPEASPGVVAREVIKVATGKDPGMDTGITTMEEARYAREIGITYNDVSDVGQTLRKNPDLRIPETYGRGGSLGLTQTSTTGNNAGVVEAFVPVGLGVHGQIQVVEDTAHSYGNAHNHFGYATREQRDTHSNWIISEFKRRYGITLRVNYDEGRPDPNSLHGLGLAGDWPGDNFPVGQELWGLRLIMEVANDFPGEITIPKPEPSVVQPTGGEITDANNNSFVMTAPGDTENYGRGGLVPPDKRIPTGVNRVVAGVGDAILNSVLPGNPLDLDKRGN